YNYFSASLLIAQLDEDGSFGLLPSFGTTVGYLYTPQAGTVEFARTNTDYAIAGLTVRFNQLSAAFGTFNSFRPVSAGDDDNPRTLSEDGAITFGAGGQINGNFVSSFAMSARIASPGCRPDYNADNFLDFFDYLAFLDCFEGGECPNGKDADFNNDD